MGLPVISDFNLDSEGHCFLCFDKFPVKVNQKHSVHYLARYLQMDMGKVFSDKGEIDFTLLTKVRRSKLKVELCEKCTGLNEMFSGLYQQQEKLEIEINSSLELIHGQLIEADRNKENVKFRLNSSMGNEVSEIVEGLRVEAIQKCSKRLRVVSPRVEIDKLTKKQINAELSKHQTNSAIETMVPTTSSCEIDMEFEGNIKTEFPPSNPNLLSDDDSRNYDMDDDVIDEDHADLMDDDNIPRASSVSHRKLGTQDKKNSLAVVSTASTSKNKVVGNVNHIINHNTGKWKCSACPKEFTSYFGIDHHYKSVHQKIRFRCVPCGKEFAHQRSYNLHHQSVHVGVRFKCIACNKLFTQKGNLQFHQRKAGCSKETG